MAFYELMLGVCDNGTVTVKGCAGQCFLAVQRQPHLRSSDGRSGVFCTTAALMK